MQKFEKANFTVDTYNEDENYGKFIIEPLERGFGTTLGNSLRRVLLSSMPGAAVFAVKINGAIHEFSAVDGVLEDVTAIILNIKKNSEFSWGIFKKLCYTGQVIQEKTLRKRNIKE